MKGAKVGNKRSVYFKESHLWTKLKNAADDDGRSVNNYLEKLVSDHFLNISAQTPFRDKK